MGRLYSVPLHSTLRYPAVPGETIHGETVLSPVPLTTPSIWGGDEPYDLLVKLALNTTPVSESSSPPNTEDSENLLRHKKKRSYF
ncbi:hypothetical protein RRG08_031589 [Elysia crispata]|uniref:Uncharacterized protein n=1 Tax=Elysia crispata TaxID=231223 RepID=A0AAE1B2R0_9GAST|nr:hypothetical protein RRG08_031589 [Elysia crispata]